MGTAVPSGTVTFLFTDVVGSTAMWEAAPVQMRAALARHDSLVRATVDDHGGYVFSTAGDGIGAAFGRAGDAIRAAVAAQAALVAEPWPTQARLAVRMGLHSGEAEERDGDFFGQAVNRAARIMSLARGGQVLSSALTAELAGDVTDVAFVPVGARRLVGVPRPVELVVVGSTTVMLDATPPPADAVNAGSLPVPSTSFVGDLDGLLVRHGGMADVRCVTLVGPGGVWFAELAPLSSGDAVPGAVAALLGVQVQSGCTLTDAVVEWMRAQRSLLILDNCEHVLDAAADLAAAIVSGAPSSTVLATSREPLGIEGEVVRPVAPLDVDSDAVELFAARALAATSRFSLDAANRDAVSSICAQLDGMPLAIELAAARVRALSPSEIASRLEDRFSLLRGGNRRAPDRHQTLRATVKWSVQLLSPEERSLFQRLSVFAGSFSLADVEAVCSEAPLDDRVCFDLLSGLVDKSMVVADTNLGDSTRYRLLETLRQYGRDALDQDGESAAIRDRHLAHFVDQARRWNDEQSTPRQASAHESFAANWDNLRAAFDWAMRTKRHDRVADLLRTTHWFAVQTFRWQHRDWAVAVRETITDTPMVAIASSVVWGAVGADPEGMPELLARLDPTAPGLAERDIALVRLAAIVGAGWSTTGTVDAVPAVEWTLEADPRCEDLVTEGWLLFNLLTQTLHDPDPRIVARAPRGPIRAVTDPARCLVGGAPRVPVPEPQAHRRVRRR
jgi:predicted ATPase/class 3 adenylate cyclase